MTHRVRSLLAAVSLSLISAPIASGQSVQGDTLARPVGGSAAAIESTPTVSNQASGRGPSWLRASHTWSLTEENDAFGGGNSDDQYTQGIRVAWNLNGWPFNRPITRLLRGLTVLGAGPLPRIETCNDTDFQKRPCGSIGLSLAQVEYTPPNLLDTARNVSLRPYAGYLYGSFDASELFGPVWIFKGALTTTEIQFGEIGPDARAMDTQSLAHWMNAWERPRPRGWAHQLRDRVQGGIRNTYAVTMLEQCGNTCSGTPKEFRWLDVIEDDEVMLANPITRASVGATVRLGFGFPDLQLRDRIATSRAPGGAAVKDTSSDCWRKLGNWITDNGFAYAFLNVEGRDVAQNNLITGTGADGGLDGWTANRQIAFEHYVGELSYGVNVNVRRVGISYQRVRRSSEYNPTGRRHLYGSITLTLLTHGRS